MSFFSYLAQISLYAVIMWGIYYAVWRDQPMLRGSRVFLLISLVLPLILPVVHLPLGDTAVIARYRIVLPEITIGGVQTAIENKPAPFSWQIIALTAYVMVSAVLLLAYAITYVRIALRMKEGTCTGMGDYSLYTNTGIGPGTLWRAIFFPRSEMHPAILNHELAHMRAGHRWDAALMQLLHIVLWASPAHWLIARELKLVHECEADRIAATGLERETYTQLLLSQSLGAAHLSIGHSFFQHPLKRRIVMLHKTSARRKKMLAPMCAALTAILISTALLAQTKNPVKPISGEKKGAVVARKVAGNTKTHPKAGDHKTLNDGRVVYTLVDKMPSFNGDLNTWLGNNLHYPDSARVHGQAGRSVVQFIVGGDGRATDAELARPSGYPLLDAEALRIVAAMPRWQPGMHEGAAVPVYFTLPVSFRLD